MVCTFGCVCVCKVTYMYSMPRSFIREVYVRVCVCLCVSIKNIYRKFEPRTFTYIYDCVYVYVFLCIMHAHVLNAMCIKRKHKHTYTHTRGDPARVIDTAALVSGRFLDD